MPEVLAGCVLGRAPGRKYVEALRFAELRLNPPLPRVPTLSRWRHETPPEVVFALSAPRDAIVSKRGPLRFDEALEKAFQWTVKAADALQARAVVVPTPVALTTGHRDRDLLAAFAERIPRVKDRLWVWAPSGLWNPELAYPLAERLGLVCAFDPLIDPAPTGDVVYARLVGLGTRTRFSEPMLREALENMQPPGTVAAYATFDSDRSFQQATLLQGLALGQVDPSA